MKYISLLVIICFFCLMQLSAQAKDNKDIVKLSIAKVKILYPKTFEYMKKNHLLWICPYFYDYYLRIHNNIVEDIYVSQKIAQYTQNHLLNYKQMDQLWSLISVFSKESGDGYFIIFNTIRNRCVDTYVLCNFLLDKSHTLKNDTSKVNSRLRRLLVVILLTTFNQIRNHDKKKADLIESRLASQLNKLLVEADPEGDNLCWLLMALSQGVHVDKKLVLRLYKKHDKKVRERTRYGQENISLKEKYKMQLKTDEEFYTWVNQYKIGTCILLCCPVGSKNSSAGETGEE